MKPQANPAAAGQHAVVIGASVAGLVAARVLGEHFESVTVLDRDPPSLAPEPRKGVPQGRHPHGLLEAGSGVLARLFPGFWEELLPEGIAVMDTSQDWLWFHHGAWKARQAGGPVMYGLSRPLLEHHLRRRLVRDCPRVRQLQGDVVSLVHDGARQRVTGVRLRAGSGQESLLEAALVVDASGRGTRAPRWLEELGYGRPPEEHVRIALYYATRLMEPPAGARDWKALLISPKPPHQKRFGYIFPLEGGRWLVSVGSYHGEHPPTEEAAFLEYSRTLHRPEHFAALRESRPLGPIHTFKVPSSRRYSYERMARFPEGFITLGDALCSFNPLFGQGMTTAFLGAVALGECLAGHGAGEGLARAFQQHATRFNDVAWGMAMGEDLRYPEARDSLPLKQRVLQWYYSQLLELSSVDPDIHQRFLEAMHLRVGPEVLTAPPMVLEALKWGLRLRGRRALVVGTPPAAGPAR